MSKLPALFKWHKMSPRQIAVFNWWYFHPEADGIIADGAVRSGKSIVFGPAFVEWAMTNFNHQKFIMSGKTIDSFKRNIVDTLLLQLKAEGFKARYNRHDHTIFVRKGNVENQFVVFGGKDASSQDLVQGFTAAGAFFDEVALMPESFVIQCIERCSVEGAKFWFNCNPKGPEHWFYKDWILKHTDKKLLYYHFTQDDNLTLSEATKERYKRVNQGMYYERNILGLWVAAEGLVYKNFDKKVHVCDVPPETEGHYYVSCDYGVKNPTVFLLWRKEKDTARWVCLNEWYYSGREQDDITVKEMCEGLLSILPRDDEGNIIKPKRVIIDPSASALITELKKTYGINVLKAKNDVTLGIEDVHTLLGENALLFCSRCKRTIKEFGLYVWDEKKGSDTPVKASDHGMDAIRYYVVTMHLVSDFRKYEKRNT